MPIKDNVYTVYERGWIIRVRPSMEIHPAHVVIALHGYTGNERSMDVFTSKLSPEFWSISPRAPHPSKEGGFTWAFRKNDHYPDYDQLTREANNILEEINNWLRIANLSDPSLSLMGFSQGATISLVLSNLQPSLFKRVAILSGFNPFDDSHFPLPGSLDGVEFFVAHGTLDEIIPVEHGQKIAQLLQDAGAQVTYCEEQTGHKVGPNGMSALVQFFKKNLSSADQREKSQQAANHK